MTTNPQDNFIQEAVERFDESTKWFMTGIKEEGVGDKTDWIGMEFALALMVKDFRKALEAQKSHIKETLLAGMAEDGGNIDQYDEYESRDEAMLKGRIIGFSTARKEDRELVDKI